VLHEYNTILGKHDFPTTFNVVSSITIKALLTSKTFRKHLFWSHRRHATLCMHAWMAWWACGGKRFDRRRYLLRADASVLIGPSSELWASLDGGNRNDCALTMQAITVMFAPSCAYYQDKQIEASVSRVCPMPITGIRLAGVRRLECKLCSAIGRLRKFLSQSWTRLNFPNFRKETLEEFISELMHHTPWREL